MSSITKMITQTPKGLYSQDRYQSKMRDPVTKKLTLTAKGKEKLSYGVYGNWEGDMNDLETADWWFESINNWDLDYYKPIRVEERLIVNGTPGLGKIAYKQKFWIKKVLCTKTETYLYGCGGGDENDTEETCKFDSYAICTGKRNGVYNIIETRIPDSGFFTISSEDDYEEIIKNLPYAIDVSDVH